MTTFRAILSNTAGELDRIECPTLEQLQEELGQAVFVEWTMMPGDTIRIEEVQS